MNQSAARIHVLLASNAPIGVVLRRGPSKRVATLLWDRRHDRFEMGQWLKGRIYERKCDLSPDGKHLIYFALDGKWDREAKGAYTAISRAPFLKALSLFAMGDTYHGGGIWDDDRTYWLNDGYGHTIVRESSEFQRSKREDRCPGFDCDWNDLYFRRLKKDGWERLHGQEGAAFSKAAGKGWNLIKAVLDDRDRYVLFHDESGEHISTSWEWAEIDNGNPVLGKRVVWAKAGELWCANMSGDGLDSQQRLYDFNPMTFEPIKAPY